MNSQIIRVLQIGDVHYPHATGKFTPADIKRDSLHISGEVSTKGARLQSVTESLRKFPKGHFDAIAFMGDFTDGNPDICKQVQGLKECITYLECNLVRPLLGDESRDSALFVPGNHDVDRTKCPTSIETRMAKFRHYEDALAEYGLKNYSTSQTSRIDLLKERSGVSLFGINTCIGCGEYQSFPNELTNKLAADLRDVLRADCEIEANVRIARFLELSEQVDAPLIRMEDLRQCDREINEITYSNPYLVPVVVGHHNLLPQYLPRVMPFAELMNSGHLREFLSGKDRPVVYLHGHIHEDPIEIVFNHKYPKGCVIAICAPEYSHGYNILQFHFDKEDFPLGVEIIPHRFDGLGKTDPTSIKRISFRQGRHRVSQLTALARELYFKVFSTDGHFYFQDVLKRSFDLGLHGPTDAGGLVDVDSVVDALRELEWIDAIEIRNRDRLPDKWNISASV